MSSQPVPVKLLLNPVHFLSLGFGSGLAPKAPGTFGTVAAILPYLFLQNLALLPYIIVLVIGFLIGIYLCQATADALQVHDHPAIVWDEFIGFWLTMLMAPKGWEWILLGFVLFRIFDIWKPWPIKSIDKGVKGGLGIMLDDVLAGLYGLVILQIIAYLLYI